MYEKETWGEKTLRLKCWYCFRVVGANKHTIKLPYNDKEITICDYCLAKLANSYFNHVLESELKLSTVAKKECFLQAIHYAKMVRNKNNLQPELQKLITVPYTTIHYYLQTSKIEKLLAKLSP